MLRNYLLLSLGMVHYSVAQTCPPPENLAPSCTCIAFDSVSMMACHNIMSAEELIPPIKATEDIDILSLDIDDSSILYVPSGVFKGTKFAKISFENSQVMSLSDGDLAFEGLENHLEELRAAGSNYVATWDWNQLRNHKKLELIDVNHIAMYSIENEFPRLPSLKFLGITKAEIFFIHPQALQGLENLELLILKENEIEEMSRSMLPTPANKLYLLDLSDNKLKSLPNDMFTKMASLKELMLGNNQFMTLNEETFSGAFNSLQTLMLNGNKFMCDCRLSWLIGYRAPLYFKGECYFPEKMRGQSLEELKISDLHCYQGIRKKITLCNKNAI